MSRSVLAIITGSVVWMATAFGSDLIVLRLFPQYVGPQSRVENAPLLFFVLSYCLAYSVLGGYVAAWVARRREVLHALVLGLVQFSMGLVATVVNWHTAPAWFHVALLALLVPANVAGGRWRIVRKYQRPAARTAAAV